MKKSLSLFILIFFILIPANAQRKDTDWIKKYVGEKGNTLSKSDLGKKRSLNVEDRLLNKLALSYSLSSMGIGINAITPISSSVNVRAGLNYFPESMAVHQILRVDDNKLIDRVGYAPDYNVNFKPNLFHGNILLDIYPAKDKPFHFVVGAYIGVGDIRARGRLKNPANGENSVLKPEKEAEGWPLLNVEGYALNINNGILDADIRMGSIIKPYIGLGFGYTIPRVKNLSFSFEVGAAYQGDYKIRQDGKQAPSMDLNYQSSAIDIKKYANYVKVWPMISFQINHRLF